MIRHLLSMEDLKRSDIEAILELTARCKRGGPWMSRALAGKTVALIFEKLSTRTRLACAVACHRLGANVLTIAGSELQIGRGETIEDSARVFSRFVDAVCWRTTAQKRLVDFARAGSIPVINTLSDLEHPCQILADLFTIREKFGRRWPAVAYVGDGANNVANSWLLAAARLGMDFRIGHPAGYGPARDVFARAAAAGRRTGAKLLTTRDPGRAVAGARVIYTDVWVSMGQEAEKKSRLKRFRGYQVNSRLLAKASPGAVVMHCLPAHRGEEITDDMMDGRRSIVFDQAENRLYNAQAVLLWCLGRGRP